MSGGERVWIQPFKSSVIETASFHSRRLVPFESVVSSRTSSNAATGLVAAFVDNRHHGCDISARLSLAFEVPLRRRSHLALPRSSPAASGSYCTCVRACTERCRFIPFGGVGGARRAVRFSPTVTTRLYLAVCGWLGVP